MVKDIKNQRNSNLEILRIIAMILIVMHHYAVHGLTDTAAVTWDRLVIDLFASGGKIGLSIFVMISGYYMVSSQYNTRKFLKMWGQVWFYSVTIYFLLIFILQPSQVAWINGYHVFFPIIYDEYGFASTFVWLMLVSPLLNLFLHQLKQIQLQKILIVSLLLVTIIPIFGAGKNQLSELGIYMLLYTLAGYHRLYHNKVNNPGRHIIAAIVLFIVLQAFNIYKSSFIQLNSIFVVAISFEMLIGFAGKEPFSNLLINKISSAAFGVYLIHDNQYMRSYLWGTLLHNQNYYGSGKLIVHAILSVAAVYTVCSVIDLIRQDSIEKLWMIAIDRYLLKWISICYKKLEKNCVIIVSAVKRKFAGGQLFQSEHGKKIFIISSLTSLMIIFLGVFPSFVNLSMMDNSGIEKFYSYCAYFVPSLYTYVVMQISLFIIFSSMHAYYECNSITIKSALTLLLKIVIFVAISLCICWFNQLFGFRTLLSQILLQNPQAFFVWCILMFTAVACFTHYK